MIVETIVGARFIAPYWLVDSEQVRGAIMNFNEITRIS